MKNKLIQLMYPFAFASMLQAQNSNYNITWQARLGGSGNDTATSIDSTTDGGFVFAGYTDSQDGDVTGHHNTTSGLYDYWVGKVNSQGNLLWQKALGGTGTEEAQSVCSTSDGGIVVAGYSNSSNGDVTQNFGAYDIWVVKLNNNGNIQWQKSIGSTGAQKAQSIKQTLDGGYIVGGIDSSNSQIYLVKLNSSGNMQWQKFYGGSSLETFWEVSNTNDGGFVFAGYTTSQDGDVSGNHGQGDAWIVKLNSSGDIQWQKCLGGTKMDLARSVIQTSDGGYIMAGYTYSNDGDITHHNGTTATADVWIVKLNNTGQIEWQKNYGGTSLDMAHSIRQTSDNGYVVVGYTDSNDGDVSGFHGGAPGTVDAWIFKTDSTGNLEWQKALGGTSGEVAYEVTITSDNSFVIAGNVNSNDGDATTTTPKGKSDVWIVKFSENNQLWASEEGRKLNTTVYPNPVKDILYFSEEVSNVKITDASGRTVKEFSTKGKSVDASNLAKGVYIISIVTKEGKNITKKIIKE